MQHHLKTLVHSLIFVIIVILARSASAVDARPVARILEIKGRVFAQATNAPARRLSAYGTLYAGDILRADPSSSLVVAFRADGHFETLRGPDEVQVTAVGCLPSRRPSLAGQALEQLRMRQQVAVEALPVTVLGASVLRGKVEAVSPGILPILRSVVTDPNPQFVWREGPDAKRYRLRIYSAVDSALIWTHETRQISETYAASRPLEYGKEYEWEVMERHNDGSWASWCEGRFRVGTESQCEIAKSLRAAVAGDDAAMVALAALWFKKQHMVQEALAAAERLVALAPEEPGYYRLYSELLERAERWTAATTALARAKQLEEDSQ